MGLFKKNPNEVAYHEGQKHFVDVIKNTGPNDVLIWRQPEEDFNTNSTLIVMPGEKAIFVKGGVVEQVFENGTYKLSTENYPFISRLRNMLTGGISVFNCVVFFVRTAHTFENRWGTESPIQVRDKLLGIATKLRCRGAYKVTVEDPVKFLEKLAGNNWSTHLLDDFFVSEFQSKIKSIIAKVLVESETEILGIDARLDEISNMVQPHIHATFSDYGLRCVKFSISAIDVDDDELRKRYDEIGMNAYEQRRMANAKTLGEREAMDVLGDDWAKQQSADILRDLANNPGMGGVSSMGAGMGMGVAAGQVFGNMANQMFEPMTNNFRQNAPPPAPSGRFVQQSAVSQPTAVVEDPVEALAKLKRMLDAGLIDQAEYDAKKAEILSRM